MWGLDLPQASDPAPALRALTPPSHPWVKVCSQPLQDPRSKDRIRPGLMISGLIVIRHWSFVCLSQSCRLGRGLRRDPTSHCAPWPLASTRLPGFALAQPSLTQSCRLGRGLRRDPTSHRAPWPLASTRLPGFALAQPSLLALSISISLLSSKRIKILFMRVMGETVTAGLTPPRCGSPHAPADRSLRGGCGGW